MSSELHDDAINLAESSEALSRILGNAALSRGDIHVTRLQDCLVNVLASSLRSFAAFMAGIDQSYGRQELEYLDAIRNKVHSCVRVLLDNLDKYLKDEYTQDLDEGTTQGLKVPMKPISQSTLEEYEKALISLTNTLTVAQYTLARHRSGRKPAPAKEIPSILAKLEEVCTHLLDSDVFPPLRSTPPPNTSLTFALYEARLATPTPSRNQASYLLICPRVAFSQFAASELEIKFRCCCEYHAHDVVLAYQVSSEGSIPVEETGPEMDMTWTMFLRRGVDQVSVRLTRFEGLSLNHLALSSFVEHLRKTLASKLLRNPTVDQGKSSEMIQFTEDYVSVLRAKLPATPLTQALYQVDLDYGSRYVVPWTPEYLQIFCYTTASKASLHALSLSNCSPIFYDEPYFWIFFSQKSPASLSHTDEQLESFSVRVSRDTQVMEPHPPTEVTVINAFSISKGKLPASTNCSEIRFKFYSYSDAKAFYDSASTMRNKIFNRSLRQAFWKEDIVYRQNPESLVFNPSKSVGAHFALVHATKNSGDDLRLIMTRDLSPRAMCFDLGLSLFDGTNTDITKTLENQKIWTVDISCSGHMDVDRPSWAQLVATSHARKPRVGVGTGSGTATLKLRPSSAAEDWFVRNIEELNLIIHANPKLRETGDKYRRVKIAVIDTGLIPNHHMAKQVKYRDFVAEAVEAKQKNNRPVTGERKDDIVQVPQDTSNSKHGTISVDIILRVYEEADLYVARVFEHDEAEETKEPFLMAEAIHWAIEQQVDIISISAGFKICPLPLRTAVHAAYTSHTLIFAAASNWGNNDLVAFPARIRDQVFCIFATNGLLGRTRYDPEPRACADNFAILGEDVQVAGGARLGQGTSAATAIAAGFAARILDFVSQTDISTGLDGVELLKTKVGMTAVFKSLVMPQGLYECIKPAKLLKDRRYDPSERKAFRQYVKKRLIEALENVE